VETAEGYNNSAEGYKDSSAVSIQTAELCKDTSAVSTHCSAVCKDSSAVCKETAEEWLHPSALSSFEELVLKI